MRTALTHPLVAIGTDSQARRRRTARWPAPSRIRAAGDRFARMLGKYVRDEKLLTLEEAIRKMTSQAASRVGLRDRGILRPGLAADVVVFDPATIHDVATFEDPNHYSVGVKARARERPGCRRGRAHQRRASRACAEGAGLPAALTFARV